MQKKITILILSLVMILGLLSFNTLAATDGILVIVNGKTQALDQPPILENGRILMPLRTIFEALGAEVDWDQTTQTVTAIKDDITIKLTIGSETLLKNDQNIKLDVPAQIVNGRVLVPTRAVSESLEAEVKWEQSTQTVSINQKLLQLTTLAMNTPLDINGYSTSIIGLELKDRLHSQPPVPGEMIYEIKFDPGTTPNHDTFVPLAVGSELIDKDGNRYRYSGSEFGNERYYNLQFAVPITAGETGYAFYWNGQTLTLANNPEGAIPSLDIVIPEPPVAQNNPATIISALPTDFEVVKGKNYFNMHSLPGNNYNATVDYFINIGDYRGRIDYKVNLEPSKIGNSVTGYWDTTDAAENETYVRLFLSFQVTRSSFQTTVYNKITIKIGDWIYVDSIPVENGTLHSMKLH